MTSPISAAPTAGVSGAALASAAPLSPEERMLALIVYTQASQMSSAKTTIDLNAEQLEKLRDQVQKALREAMEAKKDSGFWGGLAKIFGSDLASLASAVAAVAAVIGTGGAAAPILAAIAVAASLAAEHAEELGIPSEVAMGIAIAASVAALCVGDGKGLFEVSKKVKDITDGVSTYATAAAVSFKAEGVACDTASEVYERAAKYAAANARLADGQQELVSSDMDEAFDRLAAAFAQQSSAAERASSIQQQSAASSFALLNSWAGAA